MRLEFILSVANYGELGYTNLECKLRGCENVKILVINGSPKGSRSNTYRLTSAFLDGLKQESADPVEVREIEVCRTQIKPCLGCFSCWSKTPGKCCISDDMAQILEDMLWADVTVWSFPLYYFSVPGGLKNLMDRQLPMVQPFMTKDSESGGHPARFDMSGKRTVVISTCGFYTAKGNYDGVNAIFDHLCGAGNYTSIYCGQGELFRVKELSQRTDVYLDSVRRAGMEFCRGEITPQTRQELETLLFPREVFEAMADASWGVERESGQQSDETLIFTRQMAALYQKSAYPGRDMVLEMYYTDVDKRYQIVLTSQGSKVLIGDFRDYTTRIETPFSVWKAIASGELSGQDALMQQKYRVKGDFELMLHWDSYFGGETPEKAPEPAAATSTNMNILLIPWIAFWIAAAIDGFYGALISIALCALVPVFYYRSQKTFYDLLSGALVTACSAALLLGLEQRIVVSVSYLLFGAMWTASCFTKVPLTAHYSMNDYHGRSALENPLFMKTNRILTLAWGVLYLLTPIWTYFIMGTGAASWTGAINSVLPLLMGLFTGWFQKWYPAKVARGD